MLLLARGACIETRQLRRRFGLQLSCSSQEEHVLKLYEKHEAVGELRCSSQEEHVLKLIVILTRDQIPVLLLARGACIETICKRKVLKTQLLLLARGACIETYVDTSYGSDI